MEEKKEKEITVREIIIKLIGWKNYLLTKWKVIVIVGLLGGALGFVYALMQKKLYTADLTFALEEKQGGMSAYAGLASQFGLDLGKGDGGVFAGDNILELIRSRLIIENTLLTEVTIDGKKDLLLNRYITFNKLDERWAKDERFSGIKFTADQPKETFTQQQDSVIGAICLQLRKDAIKAERIDKKISIINVRVTSHDDKFAKYFGEVLVQNVSRFYIDIKTRKTRANLQLLETRVDSVRRELDQEMYGAAITQDQNQNPARIQVRLPYAKKQVNVQILTALYGELTKNLELTKLTLMREEPLIQVIDRPMLPLKFTKPGKISSTITGGFLGGLIVIIVLACIRVYKRIMAGG